MNPLTTSTELPWISIHVQYSAPCGVYVTNAADDEAPCRITSIKPASITGLLALIYRQEPLIASYRDYVNDLITSDDGADVLWGLAGILDPTRMAHLFRICVLIERSGDQDGPFYVGNMLNLFCEHHRLTPDFLAGLMATISV